MTLPLITVITPLYNYEKYIGQCIESILNQTYPHLEMIIVDDESTDNSAQIVKEYTQKHSHIRYIYQQGKKTGVWKMGVVAAVNTAIQAAQGEYIAWMSADDMACPERLRLSLDIFTHRHAQDQQLAAVYGNAYYQIDEPQYFNRIPLSHAEISTQFAAQGYVRWEHQEPDYGSELLLQILSHNVINGSTSLVHRRVFEDIGLFDENYPLAHDYEMWLRILLKGYKIHFLAEPLIISRFHHVNVPRFQACQQEVKQLLRTLWQTHDMAKICAEHSTVIDKKTDIHQHLGNIFAQKRMFDLAITEYQSALQNTSPKSLSWFRLVGSILKQTGLRRVYPLYQRLRHGHPP